MKMEASELGEKFVEQLAEVFADEFPILLLQQRVGRQGRWWWWRSGGFEDCQV
jgi:hypothetical protein